MNDDFMYRFWNSPWVTTKSSAIGAIPQMDIIERPVGFEISVAAPGANKDIEVSVEDHTLIIEVSRDTSNVDTEGITSSHKGIQDFCFNRRISLEKANVEEDKITSKYSNGILTIVLPRAESAQPKKIAVKVE